MVVHERCLDARYIEPLKKILDIGLKPIAVSTIFFEDVFAFETEEEAQQGYKTLEVDSSNKVTGWWYDRKGFVESVDRYGDDRHIIIFWLNDEDRTNIVNGEPPQPHPSVVLEVFKKYKNEAHKFDLVENKKSLRPDLHILLKIDEWFPDTEQIIGAIIKRNVCINLQVEQIETLTEDQVIELIRCGVNYHGTYECLTI